MKCWSVSVNLNTDFTGKYQGASTVPLDVITTTLRPDLVGNRTQRNVILFELSAHYELNVDTHQ